MKKLLVLTALLIGMVATAAYSQVDNQAVARRITYFGRGGVVVWPDKTTQYCPEAGQSVCATSDGAYPNDTIVIYGAGGVVVYPDGKTLYCPNPGDGVCAIFIRQNPTGGIVTSFGSGGTIVWPDGTTHYCPNAGDAVCWQGPTRDYVPSDTVVVGGNSTVMGGSDFQVKFYDPNGKEIQVQDARFVLPSSPDAKQASSGGTNGGATIK